jgi:hypothetical protein
MKYNQNPKKVKNHWSLLQLLLLVTLSNLRTPFLWISRRTTSVNDTFVLTIFVRISLPSNAKYVLTQFKSEQNWSEWWQFFHVVKTTEAYPIFKIYQSFALVLRILMRLRNLGSGSYPATYQDNYFKTSKSKHKG